MSEHKSKWYEPYKIVTILDKKEVVRRFESKTALSFVWSIEKFLFYGKKIEDGKYKVYISSLKIPPRGYSNPFLPKVMLEIITNSEGKNIIFYQLKSIKPVGIYILLFYTVVFAQVNVLVYAFFLYLGVCLLMKYWEFVRRRVGEWLEELLEAEEEE